jgi:hypothetical protein
MYSKVFAATTYKLSIKTLATNDFSKVFDNVQLTLVIEGLFKAERICSTQLTL